MLAREAAQGEEARRQRRLREGAYKGGRPWRALRGVAAERAAAAAMAARSHQRRASLGRAT